MAMFEITLTGTESVAAEIKRQVAEVPRLVGQAMHAEAEAIMQDSREHFVPVDMGTLKGSGIVQSPTHTFNNIEVILGYGGAAAPYARAVHENPRAGKTGGWGPKGPQDIQFRYIKGIVRPIGAQRKTWAKTGQWKYLEQPFLAAAKGLAERVAARVRALQGGVPRS